MARAACSSIQGLPPKMWVRRTASQDAGAERDAYHQVQADGRPCGELEDLKLVSKGAPARGMPAHAEADELKQVAGEDRQVDGDPVDPAPPDDRGGAQEEADHVEAGGAPKPLTV
jgi:hypothetical protein